MRSFEILFYPAPEDGTSRADLALPSPWLAGIPVDGDWSERYLDRALSALERAAAVWAKPEEATNLFWRWPVMATDRWLGLSPVTPEMFGLGLPGIR
jgi:hypothetical protein